MYRTITDNIIGLQGLLLEEIMPGLQPWMILRGLKYQTGSDYTDEQLGRMVN